MKTQYKILVTLATAHIGLAIIGAAQKLPEDSQNPAARALMYYATLTGADSGYGFFSPGVGSQLRAVFDVTRSDGREAAARLESGISHEADLRTGNIVTKFWDSDEDEQVRRSLAASWAGKIAARNPGAKAVTVRLETFDLPSMEEYQQGERGTWEPYYRAKFVLNQPHGGRK